MMFGTDEAERQSNSTQSLGFRPIPDWVWQQPGLTGTDFSVLCALLRLPSATNSATAWVSNGTLAKMVGKSPRTVQNSLFRLEGRSIIRRVPSLGREVGATHRLIELTFTQDSGQGAQKTAQFSRPGGEENFAVHCERNFAQSIPSLSEKKTTTTEPAGESGGGSGGDVVANSPGSRKKDRRGGRRTSSKPVPPSAADLERIAERAYKLDTNIWDGYHSGDGGPDTIPDEAELLDGKTFPCTLEAIDAYAQAIAGWLQDPGAVATYRNLVARSFLASKALEDDEAIKADHAIHSHLKATLRQWAWGKVNAPGAYFTRRVTNALKALGQKGRGKGSKPSTTSGPTLPRNPSKPRPELATIEQAMKYLEAQAQVSGAGRGGAMTPMPIVAVERANILEAVKRLQAKLKAQADEANRDPAVVELGEQIAQLEHQKEQAVTGGDFNRATALRDEADRLRRERDRIRNERLGAGHAGHLAYLEGAKHKAASVPFSNAQAISEVEPRPELATVERAEKYVMDWAQATAGGESRPDPAPVNAQELANIREGAEAAYGTLFQATMDNPLDGKAKAAFRTTGALLQAIKKAKFATVAQAIYEQQPKAEQAQDDEGPGDDEQATSGPAQAEQKADEQEPAAPRLATATVEQAQATSTASKYRVGMSVIHSQYGLGKVLDIDGMKGRIGFAIGGERTFVLHKAPLRPAKTGAGA